MTNLTSHVSAKNRNATPLDTCPVSVERPDTPSILRAAGIRLPHDQSAMDLNELHELLDVDVQSDTDTYIDDMSDLLSETKGIFPNSKLPFPPTKELLHQLSRFDTKLTKWKIPEVLRSDLKQTEKNVAEFLNEICTDIGRVAKVERIRDWNSNFCNSPLEGSPISRKPDIILVDNQSRSPVTWTSIRAIAEVTTQDGEPKRICYTVTDKSYIMLTTQPHRVFVPVISFWGTTDNFFVRLTVTDRQGQLRSQALKLGVAYRQADCLKFLRLMIGFCFAPKSVIGYDPTMLTNEYDKVVSIICDGKKFDVINTIFESQSLVGRATRVWEVEFEKRRYILKDAWVEVSRPMPEYTLLEGLQGIKGVPRLFCGENVYVEGVAISTAVIRDGGWGDCSRARIRRRVVTSSIGAHVATFSSKKELVSIFRDIVLTLQDLSKTKDLIHRDISYNNILLFDPKDRKPEEFRSGLLIDFEYATTRTKSRPLAPGSRTGTAPFMAIELLMKKSKIRHASHHDLESLFFVLIYICTNLSGPGAVRTREELQVHSSIPLSAWFRTSYSLREVGIAKAGAFCQFEENILKPFAPYFEDLKPCIRKLFKEIYTDTPGIPRPISHDKMIEIFTEALDTLPHETISIPKFEPLSVTSSSRVRKLSLGIHDKGLGPIQKKRKSLSRDGKASQASNSNWMVVSGGDAAASGEGGARTRGARGSGSRKSRSGQTVSRPH